MNCAEYDIDNLRVRTAFVKIFTLSRKLVITNSLMQYNEQSYNENKSEEKLHRES